MSLDPRKVDRALVKKGFYRDDRHHRFYIYVDTSGRKTNVKTKISHGAKTIGDGLTSLMAGQVGLKKIDFVKFVECEIDQSLFENLSTEL